MSDRGGWKADRVRFKVTQETRQRGSYLCIPCQVGWKNKAGEWTNQYVDVMDNGGGEYRKGDILEVSGRLQVEDWKSKDGKTGRSWIVWADEIKFMDAAPPSANRMQPGASSRDSDRDKMGNATGSSGMDQLPF